MKPIDVELMRELFEYRPDVGGSCLVWKVDRLSGRGGIIAKKGQRAGGQDGLGYWVVRNKGVPYKAHRVVWAICVGENPQYHLDHIDGNPDNNRIENLRLAPNGCLDNNQNTKLPKHNTSGFRGVSWDRTTNKWRSAISLNRQHYYLGGFDTPEEAHEAYNKKKAELHKFQPKAR